MAKEFICTRENPVVQTQAGKVRGFSVDGTYTFQGIKYADAKRFQMPTPPAPWEGVRDAHSYGYVCPMLTRETAAGEVKVPHRYWPKDENCQYLNIWTQSLDPEAKRPVMVWFHGGGFFAGSSIEQIAYDGENLSRFGDVVVVTINHRLNILGYLDLSPYGEKYKNSGNAGNADLAASLQWVKENIRNFGGDPDNVTIFGQSGGGGKVSTLMQTPAANGLFHKAIIMSGVYDGTRCPEHPDSRPLIQGMLQELGLTEADVEQLETLPYEALAEAYNKVAPAIQAKGGYVGCVPLPNDYYLGDPREIGFVPHARTIPTLVGTVYGEMCTFGPGLPDRRSKTREEQLAYLNKFLGDKTLPLVELFEECYPGRPLTDLVLLDTFTREASKEFCRKKAEHTQAPTYNYLFTLDFPMDDGVPAWHCADIPFFFHNTDKVPVSNIPGVSDQLEDIMAGMLVNFAYNGVPTAPGLPQWSPCVPGDLATMILDKECRLVHNFDDKLYEAYLPVAVDPRKLYEEEVTLLH